MYIKTEVLALGARPLIEHRDAAMAVQWLVEKCRASGEIPVAFCITISRENARISPGFSRSLPVPPPPPPPPHHSLFPACFRLFVLFSVA